MSFPQTATNGRVEILIAHDSPSEAGQLKHALEQSGHSVTVAAYGKEAFKAACTRKPTLIVIDVAMPDMDGYALCRRLKTEKDLKDVPVILLTSLSGTDEVVKGLECGADMFIRKPYDEAAFLSRIDYALSNRGQREHAKMDLPLQVKLGGHIHRINSEPQQILDLLISTYEDATRINVELGKKQMELTRLAAALEKEVAERTAALRAEIAEYKMAAEQLRQSEEQFRVITESSSDLIAVLDLEGRRLYNSPSYRDTLGDPAALRGTVSFDEIHPDDRERIRKIFQETVRTGRGQRAEYRFLRKDGIIRHIESQGNVIPDGAGKTAKVVVVSRDVTERKRMEVALIAEKHLLHTLMNNLPDMIYFKNREGQFTRINRALANGLGLNDAAQAVGKTDFDFFAAEHATEFHQDEKEIIRTGQPIVGKEEKVAWPDGRETWKSTTKMPLRDVNGNIIGVFAVSRDITERKRAEETLRQSEAMLRDALLAAQMGVWQWTLSTNTVTWDENLHLIAGRDPKLPAPSYQEHPKIFATESWDRLKAAVENALATGTPYELDLDLIRPDGSKRWLIGRGQPLRDDSGRITQLRGTVQDITERKRTEQALRESEERYRRLFEVESDAILVVDVDTGRILDANPAALKLYGYSREEFLRLMAGEVFAEPEQTQEAISGERAQVQLRWHRKKDGTVFPVELTGNSFVNQGRKIHVAAVRDIAERLRAEIEHTRLVTAIEQSVEAVMITNTNGDIEYVNPAFTRITGYSREEVLGHNPRILKSDKQDAVFYRQLWGTIINGQTWHGELINQRKDGSLYTEEMNIAPVRGARGDVTHFIATKQDVTERKTLEEQVRQAAKMEAIGRLAGGVAHDFNNLLTIINGYSELALNRLASNDPMRSPLNEILKAGDRAASLTRQLLAFSRQQVLAPRVLNLNDVVADVGQMLHRLIGEDINLVMVLGPALGRVKADAGQIEQILMNLCVNARDAMPEGGKLVIETANVELDEAYARSHTTVDPGRYVMLTVSDTGIGMDAETQAHIFEPFFTTKEKHKGTGLGLATVYGIVKQSGGYIWVYSEPRRGATFKVFLPRVEEASAPVQFHETHGPPVAASETILLVEDEKALCALAARILQRLGYKVLESTSPEDALQISERHTEPIHLLLTDVVLPSMSGRKVAELLAPLRPDMKVLYMSGYTDDAIVRGGVLEATAAFLQKPFTPATLARKVREVLDAGREQGP